LQRKEAIGKEVLYYVGNFNIRVETNVCLDWGVGNILPNGPWTLGKFGSYVGKRGWEGRDGWVWMIDKVRVGGMEIF
jgi:hypothetical protein